MYAVRYPKPQKIFCEHAKKLVNSHLNISLYHLHFPFAKTHIANISDIKDDSKRRKPLISTFMCA